MYAAGAILYECLTGRPPFRSATKYDTIQQVIGTDPVAPRALQPADTRPGDGVPEVPCTRSQRGGTAARRRWPTTCGSTPGG
ncbi:MAG: hypothetical protein U0797_26555 [Gemmataceae bacterium]